MIGYYGQNLILPDGRTVNGSARDLKKGKWMFESGRWGHWVDSRVAYPGDGTGEGGKEGEEGDDADADEGDMYRIPEDEKLTLEKGTMVNPESGREEG